MKQFIKDSVQRFEQKLGDNIKHDSKSFYKYVKSKQQVEDSIEIVLMGKRELVALLHLSS